MDALLPTPSDSDKGLLAWVLSCRLTPTSSCLFLSMTSKYLRRNLCLSLWLFICVPVTLCLWISVQQSLLCLVLMMLTIPYLLHVRSYVLWGSTYWPEDLSGFLSLFLPLFLMLSRFDYASVLRCIAVLSYHIFVWPGYSQFSSWYVWLHVGPKGQSKTW